MAKFCSNCGKQVNEDVAFCDGCGYALSTNTKIIKHKKQSKKCFIASACSTILSVICAIVASYLNSTALTGNGKAALRSYGNVRELARVEFMDSLQIFSAYAFVVLLLIAVILLIVGFVLKTKENKEKNSKQ